MEDSIPNKVVNVTALTIDCFLKISLAIMCLVISIYLSQKIVINRQLEKFDKEKDIYLRIDNSQKIFSNRQQEDFDKEKNIYNLKIEDPQKILYLVERNKIKKALEELNQQIEKLSKEKSFLTEELKIRNEIILHKSELSEILTQRIMLSSEVFERRNNAVKWFLIDAVNQFS